MFRQSREWYRIYFDTTRRLLTAVLISVMSLALPLSASADTKGEATSELPAAKQATPGLHVTAREAYEIWQAAPDEKSIVDVISSQPTRKQKSGNQR